MDELPEFGRIVIDSMRQPLEDKRVQIARLTGNISYPADIMLVAAMNPCPCGYYPDRNRCKCTWPQIERYRGRVSGPIMDRIDLRVELKAVEFENLKQAPGAETSAEIKRRVERGRAMQKARFAGTDYQFNGDIRADDIEKFCGLGEKEQRLMEKLYNRLGLSARAYHKVLKVARTIADLAGEPRIREEHLLEAAGYRPGSG